MVEQLLEKHERQIRRFITRRCGRRVLTRVTIDDLYQESAAAAIRSGKSMTFDSDAHFFSWIFTIARRVINAVLTEQTRRPTSLRIRRAQSSGIGISEGELFSRTRTPSSSISGREEVEELQQAMSRIPAHYRRVITMYKLDGLTLDVVAERLGKTKWATSKLYGRALMDLRREMTQS